MSKLELLLDELETKIPKWELVNNKVSKSSIGWQIDHSLLAIKAITNALHNSDERLYKWRFSFKRTLVFTINKIPRGKAKAPNSVQPKNAFSIEILTTHLAKTRVTIQQLKSLYSNNYFAHPYFGDLNVKSTIKFLEIHTQHHLHIINDIIKKSK